MGNHDAAIDLFDDPHRHGIRLDRQPYATESSEAVFARAFLNPSNGPQPSDPQRPPYDETAYAFQHGPLKIIVYNTNYWMSNQAHLYGGSPEGYLMTDQLDWLRAELAAAEADDTVEKIILIAHEPVFPNGGHVADAMWWNGDNAARATVADGRGNVRAESAGILDVRDTLLAAVTATTKVAVMLSADEHSYHKTYVDGETPITLAGMPARPALARPMWFVSSAGGGASYYARERTPWNTQLAADGAYGTGPGTRSYYSSQPHLLDFEYRDGVLSMRVISAYGDVIDRIADFTTAD